MNTHFKTGLQIFQKSLCSVIFLTVGCKHSDLGNPMQSYVSINISSSLNQVAINCFYIRFKFTHFQLDKEFWKTYWDWI